MGRWRAGTRYLRSQHPLDHETVKCSARCSSTCTGPCTAEHTRSISGPDRGRAIRLFDSRTPSDLGFCGAPGRIRTCDRRIRSPALCCLLGLFCVVACHPVRSAVPFGAGCCRLVSCQSGTAEHERSTHARPTASDGTPRSQRMAVLFSGCPPRLRPRCESGRMWPPRFTARSSHVPQGKLRPLQTTGPRCGLSRMRAASRFLSGLTPLGPGSFGFGISYNTT